MANTEWWQRGPIDGVPAMLQPVTHILLQVGESVDGLTDNLTVDVATLGDFRGVGRAQLPSTVAENFRGRDRRSA